MTSDGEGGGDAGLDLYSMTAILHSRGLPAKPHSRGLWAPLISKKKDSASKGPVLDLFSGARLGPSALRCPHLKSELRTHCRTEEQQVRTLQREPHLTASIFSSP